MSISPQAIMGLIGALLLLVGYNKDNPDPGPSPQPPAPVVTEIKVILVPNQAEEPFPDPPTNPKIEEAISPLQEMFHDDPNDALILARTFRGWAELIARDEALKTGEQFSSVYVRSTQIIFARHSIAGKYRGKIDKVVNNAIRAALDLPASDVSGVPSNLALSPEVRQKLAEGLAGVSYGCLQAYLNEQVQTAQFAPYLR